MEKHSNTYKIKSNVLTLNHRLKTEVTQLSQKAKELASKEPLSILVVDDELDTVRVLEKILKKRGYNVQIAFDGLEALKKLQRNNFDLVITDLLMPKLDGIQLLREMRKKWSTLPVIVITSLDDEQIHHQVISMGAHAYLRKPFDRKQLFDIVLEIIQPSETEMPEYLKNVADQDMKPSMKKTDYAEGTEELISIGVYE